MKESKDNIKDKIIRIYINSSKEYYYPGEKFEASILLDVLLKLNVTNYKSSQKEK